MMIRPMAKPVAYPIPAATNLFLALVVVAVNLFQFFVLPIFLLPQSIHWAWLIIPLVPFNNMMWFLIHEAIHRNLHPHAGLNTLLGRALSVIFGSSYYTLSFGHLMHHKLNREWESEFYPHGSFAKVKYYSKLLFGIYFIEVLGSLIMLIPSRKILGKIAAVNGIQEPVENYFFRKGRLAKLRADVGLILVFHVAAAYCFGAYWPVLAAIIMLRAFSVSVMDNAFHYGTPPDNSIYGKQVQAGRVVSWFILNGNHHGTHHASPNVPWPHLPKESASRGAALGGSFFTDLFLQFKGPKVV